MEEAAMKSNAGSIMLVPVIIVLACSFSYSQEAAVDREADHTALRGLLSKVTEAVNSQDIDTVISCFAREFCFTAVDQSVITNAEQVKAYYDRMLRKPDSLVTNYKVEAKADILTRFIDTNTGYCYGSTQDTCIVRKTGQPATMTTRWTSVVVKEEGQWKIAMVHVGVNFMDNPVINAVAKSLQNKVWTYSGIGLFLGVVIGVLLAKGIGCRTRKV